MRLPAVPARAAPALVCRTYDIRHGLIPVDGILQRDLRLGTQAMPTYALGASNAAHIDGACQPNAPALRGVSLPVT